MSNHFNIMPVDKSTIKTKVLPHPELLSNPEAFIRDRKLDVRTIRYSRGLRGGHPSLNLTLDVLAYKGIKVMLTQVSGDPLASITIEFNPGKCLYGHNGRILLLTEFLDALALLAKSLTPLLSNPKDWVDLIPGLRSGGRAYWSYLEIPFQCLDPDGTVLARLRHLRHPWIRATTRHWPDSIKVGEHRGNLRLSIYRKSKEMMVHGKMAESRLSDTSDILRLETQMKDGKLVHYLGNRHNVEVIDGKERLVRFYPQDLVEAHRTCFSELQGIFRTDDDKETKKQNETLVPMGRMLAQMAYDPRTPQTFPELLLLVKHYTGGASQTMSKIRIAGLTELARLSDLSRDAIFSDAAYASQFGIASEEIEKKVCHEYDDMLVHRLIADAYCPPGQPFCPHIELPGYCR